MAAYDSVAVQYAEVFDDICLRCFEWPWLEKLIVNLKPRSLLDLGCGNGYLTEALGSFVPELHAVESSVPMFEIARQRLGGETAITLSNAPAENLLFTANFFDVIVSLLSFRYMDWDRALGEIYRVLKPEGTFILIDLFAARFNPLYCGAYLKTWAGLRSQYAGNRDYRRKLKELSRNSDWQEMVRQNPKRELGAAKLAIEGKFRISDEKLLSAGLRGKVTGLVCVKK
jgi:ubiquinone/menaquinone biosynthesis C-methylase UbiE